MKLFRILDPFTITLIVVVLLASFFPARGGFPGKPLSLAVATGDCTCG